jgi:hypothetical protein
MYDEGYSLDFRPRRQVCGLKFCFSSVNERELWLKMTLNDYSKGKT